MTTNEHVKKWVQSLIDGSYWKSEHVDKHRRGISDLGWASKQSMGPPKYRIGDIVKFKAGGCGVIADVSEPHHGWPSSYSCRPIKGRKFHPKGKYAWHYEGDFAKLIGRPYIRKVSK